MEKRTFANPAIVVGLDSLPGLQSARILARHHIPVIAIARSPKHYACKTRLCQEILYCNTQTEELIDFLAKLGRSLRHQGILYPCTDMSVLLISRHRDQLCPWFQLLLPDPITLETLMDKDAFHRYAQGAGMAVPVSFTIGSVQEAEEVMETASFPVIVKPLLRTLQWTSHSPKKVFKIENRESFLPTVTQCLEWSDRLVVQQFLEGPDSNLFSVNCYFDRDANPLVTFVARKLRQWPPEAGISCLGVECRNDDVLHAALAFFGRCRLRGLGYLEFKYDERTRKHYLLEANIGRPTVRSAIAEGGGVELLFTMCCDLAGLPLPEARRQSYKGVKWINLHHDLRSAWHYYKQGQLSLRDWYASVTGPKVHAVFALDDPLPFLYDVIGAIKHRLSKTFIGLKASRS